MGTYTITTTDDQEKALAKEFEKAKAAPPFPPGIATPQPPPETQEVFLQQQVDANVLDPMVQRYVVNASKTLATALGSIPAENRAAALEDLKAVVTDNGGTLPSGEVSGELTGGVFIKPFTFPMTFMG